MITKFKIFENFLYDKHEVIYTERKMNTRFIENTIKKQIKF